MRLTKAHAKTAWAFSFTRRCEKYSQLGCFALKSKNRMNIDHKGENGWIVKYIHIPKQRRARISRGIVMRGERGESFTGGDFEMDFGC